MNASNPTASIFGPEAALFRLTCAARLVVGYLVLHKQTPADLEELSSSTVDVRAQPISYEFVVDMTFNVQSVKHP